MRKLNSTGITSSAQYPGLINVNGQSVLGGDPAKLQGLDFLQQANLETGLSICKLLFGTSTTEVYVMTGCTFTSVAHSGFFTYVVAAGWVYFNGEIYQVKAQTFNVTTGQNPAANWTPDPTDFTPNPQTELSDASLVSIHNQNDVIFSSNAAVDSGNLLDLIHWNYNFAFTAVPNVVGAGGQPAYQNTWSQFTRLMFMKTGNLVTIQGDAIYLHTGSPGGIVFTLPAGFIPANAFAFSCIDSITATSAKENNIMTIDTSGNVEWEGTTPGLYDGVLWINVTFPIL